MVEEKAVVVAIEDQAAWVETQRKAVCDACGVNKGCGTAVIARVLGNRRSRLKVSNGGFALRVGDEVLIGLQEHALLRGSLIVYGLPLLLMIGAALTADYTVLSWWGVRSDVLDSACGAAGFAAGLLWLRRFSAHIADDPRYQPVILGTITPAKPIHGTLTGVATRLLM